MNDPFQNFRILINFNYGYLKDMFFDLIVKC